MAVQRKGYWAKNIFNLKTCGGGIQVKAEAGLVKAHAVDERASKVDLCHVVFPRIVNTSKRTIQETNVGESTTLRTCYPHPP